MTPGPARLDHAIPALPVRDIEAAAPFYRNRLGFAVAYQDEGFAALTRDRVELHLWEASDGSWRSRPSIENPVRSGAESFIAGMASCRVSRGGLTYTDFGTREFAAGDLDGNLLTFFAMTD